MGLKLKRGILVGKRGGTCTPSPTWRFGFEEEDLIFPTTTTAAAAATLSARKLGANLWEVLPQLKADRGFELPTQIDDPPDSPLEEPASGSNLRRNIAASLIQHHRSVERNGHALQPVSPASYGSSMESHIPHSCRVVSCRHR
ncbi:hypothetical protein CsSME_00012952 [Camellia sinensis var. sinensis]